MKSQQLWEHALLGCKWLIEQQESDGRWRALPDEKVDAYYKTSWAFLLTGHPDAAHRNLNFAFSSLFQENGDFLPRGHEYHTDVHYLYANAYFIIGAMATGRYEVGYPALSFLLSQQDEQHGGFYSICTPKGRRSRSDTMSVSAAGLFLYLHRS